MDELADYVLRTAPESGFTSLVADGVIRGVGGVLVFLPQILLLFAVILFLEACGYMARAAFVIDRVMGWIGLEGRCFIALLSSYACAVPGILATRTIPSPKDRLATILVAPLTTCSARLPVYLLLITAFVPAEPLIGPFDMRAATLFGLYLLGAASTMCCAAIFKKGMLRGANLPVLPGASSLPAAFVTVDRPGRLGARACVPSARRHRDPRGFGRALDPAQLPQAGGGAWHERG